MNMNNRPTLAMKHEATKKQNETNCQTNGIVFTKAWHFPTTPASCQKMPEEKLHHNALTDEPLPGSIKPQIVLHAAIIVACALPGASINERQNTAGYIASPWAMDLVVFLLYPCGAKVIPT